MVTHLLSPLAGWIDVLVVNSFLAGVVFAVVWGVARLGRSRGPALQVALWSLVLIRLVLPPALGHPFAAGALIERLVPREAEVESTKGPWGAEEIFSLTARQSGPKSLTEAPLESWRAVAVVLWGLGFLAVAASQFRRTEAVRRVLSRARPSGDPAVLAVCERWRRLLRIRRKVRIVTSGSAMTPFTVGVVRPVIFLPTAVVNDSRCMVAAIAHEMAHVARFDALWLGLQHLIRTVYFFNPVVWIAGIRLHDAREQLCDATVVAAGGLAARDYVGGLLDVLRLELRGAGVPTMTNRKGRIGVRIRNVFERAGGHRPGVGGALVFSVAFGMFLLPLASGASARPAPEMVAASQTNPGPPAGEDLELSNPLPEGRITWSWGPGHLDPFTHEEVSHKGIDLAAPAGTPVTSPADGVVRVATRAYETSPGSGTVILIDHGNGFATFFAHLGSLTVREGQEIEKGAVIATVGSTGKSTGPHLHFEVRQDGESVNPADFVEEWN